VYPAALAHQGDEVDLRLGAGPDADDADAPARRERREVLAQVDRADELEDHVEGARAGEALGAMACAPRAVMASRAFSSRTVAVTRAPAMVPSWTAAVPTPAGRAVDQQALPRVQARLAEEGVVGGGEDLRKPAGGLPLDLVGHGHRRPLVHDGRAAPGRRRRSRP
jgi:hypothetical protein